MSIISNIRSLFGAKNKDKNTVPNVNSLDELHELARKYLYGDGLRQNPALAITYLEFAAQKGHARKDLVSSRTLKRPLRCIKKPQNLAWWTLFSI